MTGASLYSRALERGLDPHGLVLEISSIWRTFRCLVEARARLGVSAQALGTLRALISFLKDMGEPCVYASNRTISGRAEGISERTIRRHVGELAAAGLLVRNNSANGKRYRVDHPAGHSEAYGFDLSPLVRRAQEIASIAAEVAEERKLVTWHRKRLSVLLYRLECHGDPKGTASVCRPALRRKLAASVFESLCEGVELELHELDAGCAVDQQSSVEAPQTGHLSANDGESDRHKISSETIRKESERPAPDETPTQHAATLLEKLRMTCAEAMAYAQRIPESMWEVEEHAWTLARWCGIGPDILGTAIKRLGRRKTAITVIGLFSRMNRIRNLPAYFNALTIGRRSTGFDPMKLLSLS